MFPIRDKVRSSRFPLITVLIIIVNVFAFLYEVSLSGTELQSFVVNYGVIPVRARLAAQGEKAQGVVFARSIFTSMFLHGGWLHLISNMWFLWIFGDNVEDRLGRYRYVLFYVTCGTVAALVHALFNLNSRIPTVGASGAIAGVLGAYMILYPRARIVTLVPIFIIFYFVELPAVVFLGLWFLIQLLNQVLETSMGGSMQSVAWMAHIGGFFIGIILVGLMGTRRDFVPGRRL